MSTVPDALRRRLLFLPLLGAAVSATAQPAASPWPTQPVKIVVGFPGGSTPDVTARLVGEALARRWGQPVVVENRPGASGDLAADLVAKARDDHTLGVVINGNLTSARLLKPRLPYDPSRDFAFVSLLATAPLVLATNVDKPAGAEFFAAARAAGRGWSYGSPGIGTIAHLGMEVLMARAGMADAVHVPYAGNPAVITALIAGQVQMALMPPGIALAQAQAGKLRVVGVTGPRTPLAPGVEPLAALGVPVDDLEVWNALVGPASLGTAALERLARDVPEVLREPELRSRMQAAGFQPQGAPGETLRRRVEAETQTLGAIILAQGIRLE